MNKQALTLGAFETKPLDDDLCEISAVATDGHTEKVFAVVLERGEAALAVGQAYVTAMFEEFRDFDTLTERCACGRTRTRAFKNEEFWAGKACEWCGGKEHAFEPRQRTVNGHRTLHWRDAEPADARK